LKSALRGYQSNIRVANEQKIGNRIIRK